MKTFEYKTALVKKLTELKTAGEVCWFCTNYGRHPSGTCITDQ